jgi:hypothetical protein
LPPEAGLEGEGADDALVVTVEVAALRVDVVDATLVLVVVDWGADTLDGACEELAVAVGDPPLPLPLPLPLLALVGKHWL